MDVNRLQGLEALLFLAEEPMDVRTLGMALECGTNELDALLAELGTRLEERESGLCLRNVAGGWRLYTAEPAREFVERHVLAGRSGRLSQAALETLAVIAYKQPISRAEIGDIRGVAADGAVRSLTVRGLVEEVGRDDGPGQAVLYGTTTTFLEKIGLERLDDLPPLTEYLEDDAPDEPAPDQLKAARRLLKSGKGLPATGRAHWDPDEDEPDGEDAEQPSETDEREALRERRAAEVARRREQEAEMDELTSALDRVAKSAMTQLRDVLAAAEDEDDEDATDGALDDGDTRATDAGDPATATGSNDETSDQDTP